MDQMEKVKVTDIINVYFRDRLQWPQKNYSKIVCNFFRNLDLKTTDHMPTQWIPTWDIRNSLAIVLLPHRYLILVWFSSLHYSKSYMCSKHSFIIFNSDVWVLMKIRCIFVIQSSIFLTKMLKVIFVIHITYFVLFNLLKWSPFWWSVVCKIRKHRLNPVDNTVKGTTDY